MRSEEPSVGNMETEENFEPEKDTELEEKLDLELNVELNCLNGIKWPPGAMHFKRRKGKVAFSLNGFRRAKSPVLTHGGRVSKVPSRFLDSDSDSDGRSPQKGRKRTLEQSQASAICNNGFSTSFDEIPGDVRPAKRKPGRPKCLKISQSDIDSNNLLEISMNGEMCRPNGALEVCEEMMENHVTLQQEDRMAFTSLRIPNETSQVTSDESSSSSGETPVKKKRGRPPKKSQNIELNVGLSEENLRTNGEGTKIRATTTTVTTKKRILTSCLRKHFKISSKTGDKILKEASKRGGRPPLNSKKNWKVLNGKVFVGKNGVRKPWVRPFLKPSSKKNLLKKRRMNGYLSSPEAELRKINLVDSTSCSDINSDVETKPKKRRGRPPKRPVLSDNDKDLFEFTDEDRIAAGGTSQAKKVKMCSLSSHKQPLGVKEQKPKRIVSKLKRRTVDKAKRTLNKNKGLSSSQKKARCVDKPVKSTVKLRQLEEQAEKIESVLGMRRKPDGEYEFVVQYKDGTSTWVDSEILAVHGLKLKGFLCHSEQKMSVINRLPYEAYCKETLADIQLAPYNEPEVIVEENSETTDFTLDDEIVLEFEPLPSTTVHMKSGKRGRRKVPKLEDEHIIYTSKDVTVKRFEGYLEICVTRQTGKWRVTNRRILEEIILQLEKAETDDSSFVVLRGISNSLFCGMDMETVLNISPEREVKKCSVEILKMRYLVQMLQHYSKAIIAVVDKPAEGISAALLSLCDMVCDEETMKDPILKIQSSSSRSYCFPRLMGHGSANERLLMGHKLLASEASCHEEVRKVFENSQFNKDITSTINSMAEKLLLEIPLSNSEMIKCRNLFDVGKVPDPIDTSEMSLVELERTVLGELAVAEQCLQDISDFWKELECKT